MLSLRLQGGHPVTPLLQVRELVKNYGTFRAVNGVSFSIAEGMCFGLLGPNGAGKTTTIEMIEGIIPPASGDILFRGHPRRPDFAEKIGIQFQHTELLAFLRVRETLDTFHQLYRHARSLEQITEMCQLVDILEKYNNQLSGGQKQRLLLALALINDPELVFLDEPSTGLDPQARRNLWDIVKRIREQGKTVILTTHYMEEARYLCDRIVIVDQGQVIAEGGPEELIRTHFQGTRVTLPREAFSCDPDTLDMTCRVDGANVEILADDINTCLNRLMTRGINLNAATIHSPDLEDVFLKLTGRKLRD